MPVPPPAAPAAGSAARHPWLAILALALAAFVFNTSEFVPVGLLGAIGADFGRAPGEIGWMLTLYAWVVTLASVPGMLLAYRVERRRLLLAVLALFVASHALSAWAWSFASLLLARLGVAVAHALFWSITAALAVRLAPPGRQALALALLATGTTLALVLGVPLGRVVGQALGWRTSFLLIGALALGVMLCLRALLPRLPAQGKASIHSLPQLLRLPQLRALYLLTVLMITAQFTVYSYLEPLLEQVGGHPPAVTTSVLLVLGGSGVLGSLLFGWLGTRHVHALTLGACLLLTGCLALLPWWMPALATLYPLAAVWGVAILCFGLALQARVLQQGRSAPDLAMALFSGLYNLGIGSGALLGGQVGLHLGLAQVAPIGAGVGVLACLWCACRLGGSVHRSQPR